MPKNWIKEVISFIAETGTLKKNTEYYPGPNK